MMADGTSCRDGTYCHAGDPTSIRDFRAALEAHRRAGLLLQQQAIAAGYPADELEHDEQAACAASRQMRRLCRTVGVDAPMVLGFSA